MDGKNNFFDGLRWLVWLNIIAQFFFPIMLTFTPTIASAGSNPHIQSTRSLGNDMSQDKLRKHNQYSSFENGSSYLQHGDERSLINEKSESVFFSDEKNYEAQKIASIVSQTGTFLANKPNSNAVTSMVSGVATAAVSSEAQQWLSQFGTARIQLGTNEKLTLSSYQLDLLAPLYDQGNNLVFSQSSMHRTDERNQANFGIGLRHFTPAYMLGANLFGDYDFSRDHARMGVGAEYWRNSLKFTANGYMRMTDWKDSPNLMDYQERPANGWDIRAQAWLPSLPSLGGKLIYEKYYGKEVALFGLNNRQHNPYALTVGLNYTPIPLVTFNAEQRQGKSGSKDTLLGIELNYKLGMPWHNQVSPYLVATMRSVTNNRYDLIDRNNNIVLEYQKKDIIRLTTSDLITGYSGEQKSLGVFVNSKYGLQFIDWRASSLEAAGGKIVQNGADFHVKLPAYQSGLKDSNTYTISGVAVDSKGNRSAQSDTQITVLPYKVSKVNSTFDPVSSTLPADGKSTQILTLIIKDNNNKRCDIPVKDILLQTSKTISAVVSDLARIGDGEYEVKVTAGMDDEEVILTPIIEDSAITSAKIGVFKTITPAQATSAVATDRTSYASGDDMAVTVTLKDASDNPVVGQAAQLTTDAVTVPNATLKAGSSWRDNTDGTYTATYTATTAGTGLKATVRLAGWSENAESAPYAITAAVLVSVEVNGHVFANDAGFPTTGFPGANFRLKLTGGRVVDYNWESNAWWIDIDKNGLVTFARTPAYSGDKAVTITGTPRSGSGTKITYSFTLDRWFVQSTTLSSTGSDQTWSDANAYCQEFSVYRQPMAASVSLHSGYIATRVRSIGGLWNEWGPLSSYNEFKGGEYWVSDQQSPGKYYSILPRSGEIRSVSEQSLLSVICGKPTP